MQTSPNILFNAHTATHWANIILPLALPTIYTYTIPTHFLPKMQIGCRVEVELKNKKYSGIIKSITNEKPAYTTKEIINVLDDEPIVYPQQLALWQWIAQYYMCTEGEVMAAALPTNFKLSSETILIYNEELGEDFTHLNDEEFLVAEALLIKKELRLSEVQQILDVSHVYPVIKKLIDKNVCMVWEAMDEKYKIKRLVISTYQSVSGTGVKAVKQLENEIKGLKTEMAYPYPIHKNALPHCDDFEENGYTKEEMKLAKEPQKILGDNSFAITATAVRIPTAGGHSESVNVQFENDFELQEVRSILSQTEGVTVQDNTDTNTYPMPIYANGKDDVFVGRIRRDETQENSLNMWIVSDNLLRGAALNAVEIAETLIKKNIDGK